MTYVDFNESNTEITIEYINNRLANEKIQANVNSDNSAIVFCCKLNKEEIEQVTKYGVIYIRQPLKGNERIPMISDSMLREDIFEDEDEDEDKGRFTIGNN